MVTQIAATAPGMVALEKKGEECICFAVEFFPGSFLSAAILRFLLSGFIAKHCCTWLTIVTFVIFSGFLKRLVHDIWTVFEGGQDRKPAPPRIKHVDSIDTRSYNKVCGQTSTFYVVKVKFQHSLRFILTEKTRKGWQAPVWGMVLNWDVWKITLQEPSLYIRVYRQSFFCMHAHETYG